MPTSVSWYTVTLLLALLRDWRRFGTGVESQIDEVLAHYRRVRQLAVPYAQWDGTVDWSDNQISLFDLLLTAYRESGA